jgi:hypothetical protein
MRSQIATLTESGDLKPFEIERADGARLFVICSVESPKETANRRLAGVIFLL